MFAITGIVDPVGGVVARVLLAAGLDVRAIVDEAAKGVEWVDQCCEVAVAEMNDADALLRAFRGVEGVFVLLSANFDPVPGSPESTVSIAALRHALTSAMPKRVVCLSTIGAHATQPGALLQHSTIEREFGSLPMPVAFLRAAWFMESAASDIASALVSGAIPSFLFPLGKPVPMVAIADVGRMAARLLRQDWIGKKIVEIEGPHRTSPNDVAEVFSRLLGRDIRMQPVARDTWEEVFASQGMKNSLLHIQMLDGLNAGWIDFEFPKNTVKGSVPLEVVVRGLIHHTFETV
ncbi:NmrA family NAD(P)-binding protein [Paraburkholderia megapolitana]|uniref:NmrA family NAD(P)-binding protein n=1 Tax=Paraburkholderia megapolitana TaxID=420953 RepID=UPI0038BB97C4